MENKDDYLQEAEPKAVGKEIYNSSTWLRITVVSLRNNQVNNKMGPVQECKENLVQEKEIILIQRCPYVSHLVL